VVGDKMQAISKDMKYAGMAYCAGCGCACTCYCWDPSLKTDAYYDIDEQTLSAIYEDGHM